MTEGQRAEQRVSVRARQGQWARHRPRRSPRGQV